VRRGIRLFLFCAGALALAGCAVPPSAQLSGPVPPGPWIAAAQLAGDVEKDLEKSSVPDIRAHRQALEDALAEGAKIFPPPPAANGAVILLTDGAAETRAALAGAPARAVAVDNPYPRIGYYLASYYNNTGQPLEAIRVVGVAFKLTSGTQNLGGTLPDLYNEAGFAMEILKRWTDGLQLCRSGLTLSQADRKDRARLYHCSAYCLAELGRYGEAEDAYRQAIRLDPTDTAAPIELEFVLRHEGKAR
jgi:tetratricopeptide (TPR) repeat protein